jgi:preprotein translocase subunit SecA
LIKNYVSIGINDPYEEVEKNLKDPFQRKDKNKIENIFELYGTILNTGARYSEDVGYSEYDNYDDDEIPQPAVSNKIGRNDPCPCGSGKKYKMCCMNKLTL